MNVDRTTLADLIDERLDREEIHAIQSGRKDSARFDTYVAVLQERAPFDDPIVLPFGEHLAIVAKPGGGHVTKCLHCGHEFGDFRDNWKLEALIHVRDSEEKLLEVYPRMMHGDPAYEEIREFFCPGCTTQLEVDAVTPGYPVIHDFVPDLEGFYRDWLGREVPTA